VSPAFITVGDLMGPLSGDVHLLFGLEVRTG
jgi:hypothetical protein